MLSRIRSHCLIICADMYGEAAWFLVEMRNMIQARDPNSSDIGPELTERVASAGQSLQQATPPFHLRLTQKTE